MSLDAAYGVMTRRETSPTITTSPLVATTATAPPQTGPAAIPALNTSQRDAGVAAKHERGGGDKATPRADGETPAVPAGSDTVSYEQRFDYDNGNVRVFLALVDPKDDQVIVRIPSDQMAKYLQQLHAEKGVSPSTLPSTVDTRA